MYRKVRIMAKIKTLYLEDELLEAIMKNTKSNFSERAKDLIKKGLKLEKNGEQLSLRDHLEAVVLLYNKSAKSPIKIA